jgi:hypothetical protein
MNSVKSVEGEEAIQPSSLSEANRQELITNQADELTTQNIKGQNH